MIELTIIGRLAENVQVRQVNGKTIGTLKVIGNNGYKDSKTGQWVDRLCTLYISCYGNRATALQSYVSKGHQVYIRAKMVQNKGADGKWYDNYNLEDINRLSRPLAEMQTQPLDTSYDDYTPKANFRASPVTGTLPIDDEIPF